MKATRNLQLLVASLLCAALLAGCGAMSKSEYEKEARSIGDKVDKEFNSLDGEKPPTKQQFADGVESLDEAADELDELTPPEEVADLHDDLVETLRYAADVFEESGPELLKMMKDPQAADQKKAAKITKDFTSISTRMEKVEKGFKKQDYDLGFEG